MSWTAMWPGSKYVEKGKILDGCMSGVWLEMSL